MDYGIKPGRKSGLIRKPGTSGTVNMTRGSIVRYMVSFAVPVFLSQLFQQLYNTADVFIVGKFLGTEALAAVSSSGTLIFLMISFFVGTSMGAGVVISRYFGAGNEQKVSDAVHTNVAIGLISGIMITVLGVLFTPVFLEWMKTDPAVMPQAQEYFRFYFCGAVTIVMYNFLKGIMNAVGDSLRPLYYLILSSVLNIVLDILFVGLFRWGVWSAAFATVISQLASCVLCLVHLMKKGHIYTVDIRKIRLKKDMVVEIFRNGLPAGIQNSVIGFANVLVQTQINSFGTMAMAAYGTYSKIEGFAFLPIMSFNMATTAFVSQNLGAREYGRAVKGARFGVISSMVLAEIIGVISFIAAPLLVGAFDSSPEVITLGVRQLRTEALFYCLLAFSHGVASVLRGAGKAVVPMVIMLLTWCGLRIAYILTVMNVFGEIHLIYWAYPITWGVSSVIYLIYYLKADWVHGFG
ncbi:MAG: MATE family efflux transporter [Parasporobacterium sp.]|nr:MATE family efflux transporter [Parasporobacterium sp.]